MVDCPNCGTEVTTAVKCWTVSPRRQTETGDIPEFRVALYECPKCRSKFRSRVTSTKPVETASVVNLVEKVKEVREGLMQTLKILREKIKMLETERSSLLVEIESLKKAAELRAAALESEVNELREEIKSLKELLGSS